jgi:hypothetical protein
MWPVLGAASGMLFVALIVGGQSAPISEDALIVVELVGLILLVPFVGYLLALMRQAEGENGWLAATAFGAGLVALAVKVASIAPYIAARSLEGGTELETALTAMNNASFILMLLPLGVMVGATSAIVIRTKILPTWLGWAGVVTASALVANSTAVDAEFGPAFLLFLLWTALSSAIMTRRVRSARTNPSTSPENLVPEPIR